jgi:hypothetical protein
MTPKEYAKFLIARFEIIAHPTIDCDKQFARQCALVTVDEIIKSEPRNPSDVDWDDCGGTHAYYYEAQREEADAYWKSVKQEIKSL